MRLPRVRLTMAVIIVGVAVVFCMISAFRPHSRSEVDRTVTRDRQASIATLKGEYFLGGGFVGEHLKVNPDGRFSFAWFADDGGDHRDEGTAEIVDGLLILHVEKTESNMGPWPFPHPKLVPVIWEKRHYLIPEDKISRFNDAVNKGVNPIDMGKFYFCSVDFMSIRKPNEPK
jgi:hypothetical protein